MKNQKTKPIAVLISDIHYNLTTLPLADAAMRMAITQSNELEVPLIVAGDLHDTKANMRAECVNAMIETFNLCRLKALILIGNHDKINEKSEEHSLKFLEEYVNFIVDKPRKFDVSLEDGDYTLGYLIPYQHDPKILKSYLTTIPKGSTILMHQGLQGSDSGEYIQDRSALTHDDVKDFRVISGHYHKRQDIKTGPNGLFSYIGNPYTLGFGEANHPEKGFRILMDDGTLEFVPTNLRKHVIKEFDILGDIRAEYVMLDKNINWRQDLLWIKIKGPKSKLPLKEEVTAYFNLTNHPYRLDLIPTDEELTITQSQAKLPHPELLDTLVTAIDYSEDGKSRLKSLWRKLCE